MEEKRSTSLIKAGAASALVTLSALSMATPKDAHAQVVTATLNILVQIVRALEITINTSLDFGTLAITDDRAGNATLDPFSERLFIDGGSSLELAGGVPKAGKVQVKGIVAPITVSMEDTTVFLTNGTTAITVSNFNFITNDKGGQITVTPTGIGAQSATLAVGATVKAKQGQLTGSYVGSNRVFAHYQ